PSSSPVSQVKRSLLRELAATRAPSASSSAAIAAPIPFDAPVTSATLPASPRSMPGQVTLRPVPAHAEITALVVGEEQLDVTVDAAGEELVARRRGGGEAVRVTVSNAHATLPLASVASDGVWDLWLVGDGRELRVGRHGDGIPNKRQTVVLPARRLGGTELQPYYTVEDNLSIRSGPPAAPKQASVRKRPGFLRERVVRPP